MYLFQFPRPHGASGRVSVLATPRAGAAAARVPPLRGLLQ